jgi:predicted MFS family arabinose efflux permease
MAIGILKMRGIGGYAGWRYLFLLEGILTLIVGITSWFLMPPGPCQTKAWYRPNGWFNERRVVIYLKILFGVLMSFKSGRK